MSDEAAVTKRQRGRAAAAVAAALALGCLHDVHRIEPIAPAPPPRPAAARVLVFGDFGYRTLPQWLVARGMRDASEEEPFDLAMQLGDNIYYCGPDPTRPGAEACRFAEDGATLAPGAPAPDDPLFRVNEAPLEGMRGRDGGPLPIYLALGNHDVASGGRCAVPGLAADEASRRRACLAVARRTPTWTMPARHYVVDRGPLRLVVVDTNVVVRDYGGFTLEQEIAFVAEATRGCGGERVCVLIGHHPPAAVHWYGRGGGRSSQAVRMARLLGATGGRVRAFFAGHVHAMSHLWLDGMDVFVSGSTAMGAYPKLRWRRPARAQARFASSAWGWTVLEARQGGGYAVSFHGFGGEPLHCCEAGREGACVPVDCRG